MCPGSVADIEGLRERIGLIVDCGGRTPRDVGLARVFSNRCRRTRVAAIPPNRLFEIGGGLQGRSVGLVGFFSLGAACFGAGGLGVVGQQSTIGGEDYCYLKGGGLGFSNRFRVAVC